MRGLYTAIVTPFDAEGKFDRERFRSLIKLQIGADVDGIVVLGTTGETPTLSSSEKEESIALAREETLGKVPLMVGTGSYSTAQTIENTKEAKAFGADSVLIVSPYYNRPTQEGLFLHFKAITEAVDIPIMLYNHHVRTGQNMNIETIVRIAELPNIFGIKEGSGNFPQMIDILDKVKEKKPSFSLMCGDDLLTMPCMSMGGDGSICVVSNLIPLQMKSLVSAMQNGNLAKARELHFHLLPIFRASCIETNPIPIKAMMKYTPYSAGKCRLPLCDLLPENEKKINELMNSPDIQALIDENKALYGRLSILACTC